MRAALRGRDHAAVQMHPWGGTARHHQPDVGNREPGTTFMQPLGPTTPHMSGDGAPLPVVGSQIRPTVWASEIRALQCRALWAARVSALSAAASWWTETGPPGNRRARRDDPARSAGTSGTGGAGPDCLWLLPRRKPPAAPTLPCRCAPRSGGYCGIAGSACPALPGYLWKRSFSELGVLGACTPGNGWKAWAQRRLYVGRSAGLAGRPLQSLPACATMALGRRWAIRSARIQCRCAPAHGIQPCTRLPRERCRYFEVPKHSAHGPPSACAAAARPTALGAPDGLTSPRGTPQL